MSSVLVAAILCFPSAGESWGIPMYTKCTKAVYSAVVLGVLRVVSDLVIFSLPFPIVFRMQLGRRKKIGLGLTFSVGFL